MPTLLDFDPENKKITFQSPEIYSLELQFSGTGVYILYYGEDDSYLSEILCLEEAQIAYGDLNTESFSKIQERALKVLGNYIIDSQKELIDLFNEKL